MRTREGDSARILRRYKETIEALVEVKAEITNCNDDNVLFDLVCKKIKTEGRFNKLRGTIYRMLLNSSEPFQS